MSITLTVNGEPRQVPPETTVGDLLARIEIQAARVAVEHNGVVLPRGEFPRTVLNEGDHLEIVQLVGGG